LHDWRKVTHWIGARLCPLSANILRFNGAENIANMRCRIALAERRPPITTFHVKSIEQTSR
jgi:hypothetical protein